MFCPIPSLNGKYEINKKGVVRNAKTKKILKQNKPNSYSLRFGNKQSTHSVARLLAEVFEDKEQYLPIPSLDYKYEISNRGIVRNVRTKRTLRKFFSKFGTPFFSFKIKGSYTQRNLSQLLWEVHGILPKKISFLPSVEVTIQKGVKHYSFPSITKCAKYLAPIEQYSFSWIRCQLVERRKNIYGWKIFYREPEKIDLKATASPLRKKRRKCNV